VWFVSDSPQKNLRNSMSDSIEANFPPFAVCSSIRINNRCARSLRWSVIVDAMDCLADSQASVASLVGCGFIVVLVAPLNRGCVVCGWLFVKEGVA
jgi:hypothetical protein